MKIVIVYESMFGNTHAVAEAIAAGLGDVGAVTVGSTTAASFLDLAEAELLVVGGPTHAHGLSSKSTRRSAQEDAVEDTALDLDEDAGGPGLRDWFKKLPDGSGRFGAAFDTRIDRPEIITGSAAHGIARRLRHHGYKELLEHESFVLEGNGPVLDDELERARKWGESLAGQCKALNIQ